MSTNNQENFPCGYQEQLVSYIYDEIGAAEKIKFEGHVDTCKRCAAELSAFTSVRSSINDWKEVDFLTLETPSFEIPVDKPVVVAQAANPSTEKAVWIDKVRGIFTDFPGWATSVSFAAVVVLLIGIAFIAVNFTDVPELSERESTNNSADPEITQIVVDDSADDQTPEGPEHNELNLSAPQNVASKDSNSADQKKVPVGKDKVLVSNKSPEKERKQQPVVHPERKVKPKRVLPPDNEQVAGEMPKLSEFSLEEDNSLRLADLFGDIDSK